MIDYALRRRFSFFTMKPAFESAEENDFAEYAAKVDSPLYHEAVKKIKKLDRTIRKDSALGKGFEIGHSYFVPKNISDIDDEFVRNVIEFEIIPLIEEYWFDNEEKAKEWTETLFQLIGEENDGR